jgi:hypothetical protein
VLLDDIGEMPAWIKGVLTEGQACAARTSELWRWRRMIYAVDITPTDKSVAICLADHCGEGKYECWPSIATLGKETGWGRDAIMRSIRRLERYSLIFAARSKAESTKRQNVNRYTLLWPLAQPVRVAENDSGRSPRTTRGSSRERLEPGLRERQEGTNQEWTIEGTIERAAHRAADGFDSRRVSCPRCEDTKRPCTECAELARRHALAREAAAEEMAAA